jgi:hypothetical protein
MDSKKFLGICILLAAIVLAGAIVWHAKATSQIGRYQFQAHSSGLIWIIDTTTGEIKSRL